MFPLLPIAVSGGVLAATVALGKKRKPAALLWLRDNQQQEASTQPQPSTPRNFQEEVTAGLVAVDERYQRFVQTHIDPLLGKERHAQLQEMLEEDALTLSLEERFANWRLALGTVTLGTAVIGELLLAPLIPVAITLGLVSMSNNYYFAWLRWKETKRFGAIHLLCIYIAFLWLGGYAAVGALGAVLLGVGLKVKAISENQSRNNLINIFQLQPGKVWVHSNGLEVEIPFEKLQAGDILVLQAGQIVPVDGTIVAGVATVDQHMLTGEAQPVEKSVGDVVFASTVLLSGKVDISVEKTGAETTAGQIGEILNQSAEYNSTFMLKVVEMTDRFALPTLALSALGWPIIGPAGAVSLMGANSTITTYMSGSLAMLNFLNLAAAGGILIKDGSALEQLNDVDTVVFDKTGTLTLEQPHVAQIHTLNRLSEAEILTLAAAAEARQTHPIARAILVAATERNLHLPAIDEARYEAGYGLKVQFVDDGKKAKDPLMTRGTTSDHNAEMRKRSEDEQPSASRSSPLIRVGSSRFMTMEGIGLPAQVQTLTDACQAQGHSLVMVAVDDELVGCIELQPTVRPEAQRIIEGLRARGLALYIISGDQEAPTRKLADDLGMTGYFADILPEAKADLIEQLQKDGCQVCFIGDGINDAIAMRKAEVSVSLRGSTTAATDTAQIILMDGTLNQLVHLLELAEAFDHNLKRNLRFTAGVSLISVAGILLAGFTFAATEIFYTISLLGGLGIAMKPLLDHQQQNEA
ncbi:heavy metal translocating P-type ATPase [Chloroflexi bacterium TSY]|nr:heavy metal translocating P-type ATPase [Chloroflexi bacterium TSY]